MGVFGFLTMLSSDSKVGPFPAVFNSSVKIRALEELSTIVDLCHPFFAVPRLEISVRLLVYIRNKEL